MWFWRKEITASAKPVCSEKARIKIGDIVTSVKSDVAQITAAAKTPDEIIAEYDNAFWFTVDGKKSIAIPDPDFVFPEDGTAVGGTNLKIGDKIELKGKLLNGTKYELADSEDGTATLVVFWFSACGACLQEFPVEKAFYSKYKDRGIANRLGE